jgi:hypothetical protein
MPIPTMYQLILYGLLFASYISESDTSGTGRDGSTTCSGQAVISTAVKNNISLFYT